MREDGNRLSYTIRGTTVTITNNMDGTMFAMSGSQTTPICNIDLKLLYEHIQTLQELIVRNKVRHLGYKPFVRTAKDTTVTIVECDHYSYRIIVHGKCAELNEFSFSAQFGFDTQKLLNALSYAYSVVSSSDVALRPARDIVRRIADVGILVWVYEGHTLVCKDVNISGCTLVNCLVDDHFYDLVYVSSNIEHNKCYVFDKHLEEIFTVPLDKSVLTYFPPDTENIE